MYLQTVLERRIRARAAALGLTSEQLAKAGGISRSTMHIWLKTGVMTSKGHRALGAALGVSAEWFTDPSIDRCLDGIDAIVGTNATAVSQ